MNRANVDRTYLYVSPEEKPEVEALGACWDDNSKRWYLGPGEDPERFSKWLPHADNEDEGFTVTSDHAYVACAHVSCWNCDSDIEVICIYCESGLVADEPLNRFTVCCIWAMDESLARQLDPWPYFRKAERSHSADDGFANYCPHCNALQEDLHLSAELDQPFFNIPRAAPGTIKLNPLIGRIQLSGDASFEV